MEATCIPEYLAYRGASMYIDDLQEKRQEVEMILKAGLGVLFVSYLTLTR